MPTRHEQIIASQQKALSRTQREASTARQGLIEAYIGLAREKDVERAKKAIRLALRQLGIDPTKLKKEEVDANV